MAISCHLNMLQSQLYYAAMLATLKSGRLIEVKYKLRRKGGKHDFVDSI